MGFSCLGSSMWEIIWPFCLSFKTVEMSQIFGGQLSTSSPTESGPTQRSTVCCLWSMLLCLHDSLSRHKHVEIPLNGAACRFQHKGQDGSKKQQNTQTHKQWHSCLASGNVSGGILPPKLQVSHVWDCFGLITKIAFFAITVISLRRCGVKWRWRAGSDFCTEQAVQQTLEWWCFAPFLINTTEKPTRVLGECPRFWFS